MLLTTYNVSKTKRPAFCHYFAKYGQILDKFSEFFHWQIPNDTFCISAIDIYYKRVALRSLLCSSNSLVISYGMWVPVAVWQCYFTLLHLTTSIRILTNWPTDWLTDWLMSDWLIVGLIDTLIIIISVPVTDVAASLTPDRFFTLSLCVWHAQSITAAGAMTASVRHWTMPAGARAYSKRVPRTNCALRIKKCAPRISSGIYFLSTSYTHTHTTV